jgi:hypothetical protein
MTSYADSIDRVRLLYRLPTAPGPGRTLEVRREGVPPLFGAAVGPSDASWELESAAPGIPALPFAPRSFDMAVLHRTLEAVAARGRRHGNEEITALLRAIADVLVPAGLVVGCVQNPRSLWALSSALRRRFGGGASASGDWESPTVSELGAALAASGYTDARFFSLVPDCDEPMRLIDADPVIARSVVRRELQPMRGHLLLYLFKRLVAEAGVYPRLLTRGVLFWAYRRC